MNEAMLLPAVLSTVLVTSVALAQGPQPWERLGSTAGEQITGPDGGRMVWALQGSS